MSDLPDKIAMEFEFMPTTPFPCTLLFRSLRTGMWLLLLGLYACSDNAAVTEPDIGGGELPPGFMDEPPPPPESDTLVLSGGTLMLANQALHDSVIVIANGKLVAWGKRGETAMPNDSIGYDMRGKWLVPQSDVLQTGDTAAFNVLGAAPETGKAAASLGTVVGAKLTLEPLSEESH